MKLRYFLGVALSALLFAGCSDDKETLNSLNVIELDQTYVAIPETGGDVTVTVKAQQDWKFDDIFSVSVVVGVDENGKNLTEKRYYPLPVKLNADKSAGEFSWLTASQLSGAAGETTITFHADATSGGREAELRISTGGSQQFIVVRQGSMEAATATCQEVIDGADGKTFRVRGTCTAIANTTYGNWYLTDATGQVYIYGTLDANGGTKNFTSLGIEVGDVITVEGPKTTYGTTVELVDVTVVKIEKSLLKVISAEQTFEAEGGNLEVTVAYKGSGAYASVDSEAASWLTFNDTEFRPGIKTLFESAPADTAVFKFTVAPNESATRKSVITFKSGNTSSSSSVAYTVTQKGVANPASGKGTEADPYNVTAALAAAVAGTDEVYVKGIVSQAPTSVNSKYGSCTYYISADGKQNDQLQIYGGLYFNKEKFTSADQIKEGDEVVVVGKLKLYNGTPEMDSNNWIYSINGSKTPGGAAKGTVDNPFNVADAIAYIDGGGSEDVYVEGTVSKIVYTFDVEHGTGTFWISADGTFNEDKSKDFEAYGVYWLGNKSWAEGNGQVAVGDKVVLCGKLTNYKGTYETSSKKAYIYSLNGKTE